MALLGGACTSCALAAVDEGIHLPLVVACCGCCTGNSVAVLHVVAAGPEAVNGRGAVAGNAPTGAHMEQQRTADGTVATDSLASRDAT